LGEDALLRGDTTVKAHIARDLEVADREGNVGYAEYVLTIEKSYNPVRGDTLAQSGETFVLELPLDDNGYTQRFILRKTA
jgi:hypothetical protein